MKKKKYSYFIIILIVIISVFAANMFAARGGNKSVVVNIPKGASVDKIAEILEDESVIKSKIAFKILSHAKNSASKMKSGAYRLNSSMTPSSIINIIVKGDTISRWLTIPEGYTIKQIAEKIEKEGYGSAAEFVKLAALEGDQFDTPFPSPGKNLEGYLFPDTYLITIGITEKDIITEMYNCFNRKVYEPLKKDISASGMSLHEIITLASLIEREARVPKDRAMISSVLRNRLDKKMRLAVDATVLYALGEHKSRVLYRDLEIDSPYNTYKYAGLPPGPIANPGVESIRAAIHPAKSDCLFYVAKPDGSHIFTKTFEEHKKAISEIRLLR